VVGEFERRSRAGGGYGCWSFSNHDCVRVVSRWGRGTDDPAFPKLLLAVLGTLRGSFCVYQGEELGLPEAEVPFNRLIDPYGITFWPDFKGRDGCRTPMPWTADDARGGFSAVEPWLPMSPRHLRLAVALQQQDTGSVMRFCATFLAWRRRQDALRLGSIRFPGAPEPLLAIERRLGDSAVIGVFNLGPEPLPYALPRRFRPLAGHGLEGAALDGRRLSLPGWGGFFGQTP
jgi:alpha-glucosidase